MIIVPIAPTGLNCSMSHAWQVVIITQWGFQNAFDDGGEGPAMVVDEVTSQGIADSTQPPRCILGLESHQGAKQHKCWSRLSSYTLDLALVIGHALSDWDKVIACFFFHRCPLPAAACTHCIISALGLQVGLS